MAKKATAKTATKNGLKPASAKDAATTLEQALKQLESLGNETTRKQNAKWAYGGIQPGATQFGVKHGDIRTLAKTIGPDHALALSLWDARNVDAQLLACLLMKPKMLSVEDIDRLVRSISFAHVADWLHTNAIKDHPDKETLRQRWMTADNCWAARAGWGITSGRVAKSPEGLDLSELLDRIEAEMGAADPAAQWTMNNTLAAIGITRHLLDFIADERNLAVARDHLERYGGRAPGVDGHTFDMLAAGEWWEGLRVFRDEIKSGGYAPARDLLRRVPKGSGRGYRTIAVQTLTDRVVGRAALQVLQPVLDRFFDPLSFGGRPGGALDALAAATHLHERGHTVWVAEDLRDAFARVPLPRLLDVAAKSLGIKNRRTDRLYAFLKSVVSGASVPGLRQGNPLSPFLMNVFLDHHLDRRWRKAHPRWPLLRYIDDLLIACPSRAEAREAHAALVEMLVPTGMLTKLGPGRSVRSLDARRPVQWLGFAVYRARAGGLRILPGERAWDGLAEALSEPGLTPDRAAAVVRGWVGAMGPCYPHAGRRAAHEHLAALAGTCGAGAVPGPDEVEGWWQRAYARWQRRAGGRSAG